MNSYVLYKTYVSVDAWPFPGLESSSNMKQESSANTPAYQPLYRQIKNLITESLVTGEWRPGDSIPSELELASRYSVSQGTVRKAISELAEENLLVRHQGRGTFVASHSEERSKFPYLSITPDKGEMQDLSAELLELRKVKLDAASARKLALAGGSSAFLIRRTVSLSGSLAIYEEIRLPAPVFKGLTVDTVDRFHCMLYSMYETEFQLRILYVEEQVRAQPAEAEVADMLEVSQGAPLLVIDRVAYTYADKPVELRRSYCNTREHHYRNRII
jgi:GntR family transcriptional regulator